MKKKKLTYNELGERVGFIFNKVMEIERAVNYVHSLIVAYVDSNDHSKKLIKYLKEQEEKNEQANRSDTKGDRKDKSGDSSANSESK